MNVTIAACTLVVAGFLWTRTPLRRKIAGLERVVILGASSGIGYEMALEYARRGSILFLVARNADALHGLAKACEGTNASTKCHVIPGDLTQPDFVEDLARRVESKEKHIDTLIICAGALSVLPFKTLVDSGKLESVMHSLFETNVYAPIRCAGAFLPLLSNGGHVVVVSSAAGVIGAPTRSLYASTKHALQGFFNSVRIEWRQLGLTVTLAIPGSVNTGLRSKALDGNSNEAADPKAMSPLKCARGIIQAADTRSRDVYMPYSYRLAHLLTLLIPNWIDSKAAKKYGF